ncbi:MAG: deoxyribodipyrimidine photo-lyase [Pseudomonadota bacterium]
MSGLHISWFRQDLRVHDNAALRAAAQSAQREGGEVLPLYILPRALDPAVKNGAQVQRDALTDLRAALRQRDAELHLRQGDVLELLSDLHAKHQILSLHAHETLEAAPIDASVEAWALRAGVRFHLYRQFQPNVMPRGHESWQTVWERFMARPRNEAPDHLSAANIGIGRWLDLLSDEDEPAGEAPQGGRKQAILKLRRFLGMATPDRPSTQSGQDAFKALEPDLRLGAVSIREVWQAAIGAHQQALKAGLDIRAASIASFLQMLPSLSRTNARGALKPRAGPPVSVGQAQAELGDQLSLGFGNSDRQKGESAKNY